MTVRRIMDASAASALADTDKIPCSQSAVAKYMTPLQVSNYVQSKLLDIAVQSVSGNAASITIDLSLGFYVILTLSANLTTLTLSNWRASPALNKLILDVRNTGAFNITSWASALWAGGSAPTVTSGNGKKDVFAIHSPDAGTTKFGSIIGQNFS